MTVSPRDLAVVGERVDDRLRHRVDHAGGDQLLDVDHVAVVGVLGRGRRPQRTLRVRAGVGERLPAVAGEHLARSARRPAGRWRWRPCRAAPWPPSRADLLQPLVDLGVHPGHEERRRPSRILDRSWPLALACSRPARNASITCAVALQREDQRDVDADALGERRGDRRQAGRGRRDLDEQVGPVDQPPQRLGLGDGRVGLVGQPRVDLDGDPAVDAGARVVRRPHHVAGPAHVVRGEHARRLVDADPAQRRGRAPAQS